MTFFNDHQMSHRGKNIEGKRVTKTLAPKKHAAKIDSSLVVFIIVIVNIIIQGQLVVSLSHENDE